MNQPPPCAAGTEEVRLDCLGRRTCGIITRIEADSDDMDRLKAMGVCTGRKVELVQPGDPMILRVFSSRIGVSRRLAQRIMARPCDAAHCVIEL